MEPQVVPISSSPPHDSHSSPVGSPQPSDSHFPEISHPSDDPLAAHITSPFTTDLFCNIIKQVEYYFSDENLSNDNLLMGYLTKDVEGFVPVGVIASFRKMKKLTKDKSLVVAALRESTLLVVSSDGNMVKRLHPFPFTDVRNPEVCTVLVENLPPDHSVENIQHIFGEAGNIKNICIHVPQAVREPRKPTIAEKLLSSKLYARVEYETLEAAEKAVATLNDEQDWRYGMRVKLLKRAGKHGHRKNGWKELDSEKTSSVIFQAYDQAVDEEKNNLNELHEDSHDEENGEHISKEKNGHRGRNRARARKQKYRGTNGQGHGTVSSSHGRGGGHGRGVDLRPWKPDIENSKPAPVPRMPDGTRGFTMGRGRPLASNPS